MDWSLISFSKIGIPMLPFTNEYFLGIVENDEGQRAIVQIDQEQIVTPAIGMKGYLEASSGPTGKINFFKTVSSIDHDVNTENEIKSVGIIGAGTMGTGIAQVVAQAGLKVVLTETSPETIGRVLKTIDQRLLKVMSAEDKDRIISAITATTKLDDLADSDLIIECISEDLGLKMELFKKIDLICSNSKIIATNTSSLSIDELASCISNPDRFIGIHFFNPAVQMKLVEIVDGQKTADATLNKVLSFIRTLNKEPIIVKNTPGFIVNRILFTMINDSCYMVDNGIASVENIDSAMKLGVNWPMGPFELADYVGLDISYNIINQLSQTIEGFKTPAKCLEENIKNNRLGRKNKKGFYDY